MIPEDERDRRGEPVILIDGKRELEGTIEWGGVTQPMSIYTERCGRFTRVSLSEIRSDPGGKRPVWDKVTGAQ